ncbi:MAG: UDP-N-acetylmuramoyl-tripeptide--D-alanyl-D-alanine ligase [Treponema sp.]|nr:UDP-N-acetylmuramoyl-tripeptide--D-alanyl-D-alanine ligase [Treponema sp.]
MESLMSFSGLSHAIGGRLFAGEGKQAADLRMEGFSSVSIDSRVITPGGLFVALRGSSLDGHRFVDAAFKAGACGALVALSAMEDAGIGLLGLAQRCNRVLVAVEDSLKGLQEAAAAYLKQFSGLLKIGITGSAGKTTTKEIAAAIIGQEKKVVMNEGNLNSETGLPLSVFKVRAEHQVGVFEAGMNRPGEIAELAAVLNPDLALITNIGSAHIGILGSRRRIAEEKKQIFSAFNTGNTALIPEADEFRDFLSQGIRGRTVFYGPSSLTGLGGLKDLGLEGTGIIWEGEAVRFALPGKYNLSNAFAAIALALELPVRAASIRRGLESVKPLFGRGEIFYGRTTLIRDCYNSSPESAQAALDFCDSLEIPGRRIYVMGSMLELGDSSEAAHADLGRRLAASRADKVFLFGDEMSSAADQLGESFYTQNMDELSKALDGYVKNGDLVLLKASRGCELEALTEMLLGDGHAA